MTRIALYGCLAMIAGLAGCGEHLEASPPQAKLVFPDAEPLAHRHRNHSMTESPDGTLRIYAAQKGDETDLMLMHRLPAGGWSKAEVLDLPRLDRNTSPRFFPDGTLYYSSDGPHPNRPGRKDLNIWRVTLDAQGNPGKPDVLPDSINTGSSEDGFAPLEDGRAVFSSTTIGGVGGYDLYIAEPDGDDWSVTPFPHNTAMADSHPVTTTDGKTLIWYAHLPREAHYGVVDLFVSHLQEGEWSAPENLGPAINTSGIDYGPGDTADGRGLYFSREGVMYEVNLQAAIDSAGYVTVN